MCRRFKYALIGNPIGHSFSQEWFELFFRQHELHDCSYSLCQMDTLPDLHRWVEQGGVCGFNVTSPYKIYVMRQLDRLSPQAAAIGAVNCVKVCPDGSLEGHNTDWQAFAESLVDKGMQDVHQAFVLGTGGAARAVGYALASVGVTFRYVSRHPEHNVDVNALSYAEAHASAVNTDAVLLVNATPVGMAAMAGMSPWEWGTGQYRNWKVYDLVYNPSPTLLMQQAAAHGAEVTDGLDMLHRQAFMSWQVWCR